VSHVPEPHRPSADSGPTAPVPDGGSTDPSGVGSVAGSSAGEPGPGTSGDGGGTAGGRGLEPGSEPSSGGRESRTASGDGSGGDGAAGTAGERAAGGGPDGDAAGAADGAGTLSPLPDVPGELLSGYLDAALAQLRVATPTELPGALRQYRTWSPRKLRHPRVVGLVKRSLDTDPGFRAAVDRRVLDDEETLARLVRAGRHGDALASGESPEVVARVGIALGDQGAAAVQAAAEAAVADQARAEAAKASSALVEAESELQAARARAESEVATTRAAREDARAARDELRRAERQVQALGERVRGLEQELSRQRAAVDAARAEAAAEQRRLNGRIAELQARLTEAQRQYRQLRRASTRVDPVIAEAVGTLERDLDTLRRATGLTDLDLPALGRVERRQERREPLPVPAGRDADDPETLSSWMAVPGVLVLVDGYNVTKHERGFPDRGLEDQRTLLIDLCRRLARRWGAEVTVVFDGAEVTPMPTKVGVGAVGVVFTDADRIADDEIVARVNAEPPERPVVVVTSDNELRQRTAALGASVARSPALLGLSSR
jgi:predicted RNA-binding protein with PIN domain